MIAAQVDEQALEQLWELNRRFQKASRELSVSGDTAVTRTLGYIVSATGEIWQFDAPYLYGVLASATRSQVFDNVGKVFIDPTVTHPVLGGRPVEYGPVVHERDPWVEQLVANDMPYILAEGGERLFREMDGLFPNDDLKGRVS